MTFARTFLSQQEYIHHQSLSHHGRYRVGLVVIVDRLRSCMAAGMWESLRTVSTELAESVQISILTRSAAGGDRSGRSGRQDESGDVTSPRDITRV